MENNKRRIASLALFRNLYNEGRSDVMTILCEFAKNIVNSKHLTGFTPTQIKNELKSEYEFYIPEYVVESVIKKFCRKDNSMYYPNEDSLPQKVNDQEIERIEKSHEVILSKLVSYIEEKLSKELTDEEKEKLFQSFCRFIIDESDVEYSEYISTFIIETQNNNELTQLLQTIKEGVILYTGIQYNDNINETGSWNDDFTIYLEQEILFHLAGYNGVLYQQLFQDFFDLVREVNQKSSKHLIKLKYFDRVKIEIEKFFNTAERIVDGKDTLDCSNIAMTTIVQGCEYKTDVIAKKCAFFDMLKKNSILEDNGDAYFKENSQFNIFYEDNLTKLTEELPERDIEWSLQLLNYISMIRRGYMSGFEKSKCILLTGNSTTLAVANHPLIKQNGNVPLATSLDYLTNKLWFKLNKGFGSNVYPKSFNIVTKAQIILSSQIVGSVSKEFERIKKEISEKSKSEDVIIAELAELKNKVRKPEEVVESNIDETLNTINMADTERYLREREMERIEAAKQKEENERLLIEMDKVKQEKVNNESKAKEVIRHKEDEISYNKERLEESRKQNLRQIEERLVDMNNRKHKADDKVSKHIKNVRWIPWFVIVLIILTVAYITNQIGWVNMGILPWIISALIASLPYLFFAIGGKSWNPQAYIDGVHKKNYTKKMYLEYGVDVTKIKALEEEKQKMLIPE